MTVELSLADAHDLAVRVLTTAGATATNAGPVADAVVTAQAEGIHSHGLTWLTTFADHLHNGKVNGKAQPQVETADDRNVVTVDGAGGVSIEAAAGASPSSPPQAATIRTTESSNVTTAELLDIPSFSHCFMACAPP